MDEGAQLVYFVHHVDGPHADLAQLLGEVLHELVVLEVEVLVDVLYHQFEELRVVLCDLPAFVEDLLKELVEGGGGLALSAADLLR